MKKRLKPILIITVVLVILVLLGILIRNKIIINKIYDLESKYKSATNYQFKETNEAIDPEFESREIIVSRNNDKMVIEEGNIKDKKTKTYIDCQNNIAYMFSEEQGKYIPIENYTIGDFSANAFLSEYISKKIISSLYNIKPICSENSNYVIKYDNSTYYIDKNTFFITKIEREDVVTKIECKFDSVDSNIRDIEI